MTVGEKGRKERGSEGYSVCVCVHVGDCSWRLVLKGETWFCGDSRKLGILREKNKENTAAERTLN